MFFILFCLDFLNYRYHSFCAFSYIPIILSQLRMLQLFTLCHFYAILSKGRLAIYFIIFLSLLFFLFLFLFILLFFFFYISVCISLLQAIIHPLSRLWLCMTDIFHFALVCINLLLYDVQREQIDHLSDRSPRTREQNDNTRRLISSLLPLSPSSFLFLRSFLRCVKLK